MDNTRDTTAVRDQLMERRAALQARLDRVRDDVRHAAGLEADSEEQALQLENDDVLTTLDDAIRKELIQIDDALARLGNHGYGICQVCGKPISAKRLAALPTATRCVNCQQKA